MNTVKISSGLKVFVLIAGITCLPSLAETISPKEAYLKYRTALAAATKIDDLQPMLCKKANDEIKSTPAEMKPLMIGLMQDMTPKTVQVVSETIGESTASLTLASNTIANDSKTKEKAQGKVIMVKEDGVWKIGKESWESKVEMTGDLPSLK